MQQIHLLHGQQQNNIYSTEKIHLYLLGGDNIQSYNDLIFRVSHVFFASFFCKLFLLWKMHACSTPSRCISGQEGWHSIFHQNIIAFSIKIDIAFSYRTHSVICKSWTPEYTYSLNICLCGSANNLNIVYVVKQMQRLQSGAETGGINQSVR